MRAYVSALRHRGIRPRRVVTLAPRRDPGTGKEVGRWMPGTMRAIYAARMSDARQNYWPRRLKRVAPDVVRVMREQLGTRFPFFELFFEYLDRPSSYHGWVGRHDTVLADGLADPALAIALAGAGTVLFTGGGFVPASLLATPGTQFIHVHPGLLPHVRGADGLLWSTLVRGRPGRTAFVLTTELDSGPIVEAEEVEPLRFELSPRTRLDAQVLYRALYSYYDPCLRAELAAICLMMGKVSRRQASHELPAPHEGPLFPFMSDRLRAAAQSAIFR